MGTRLLMTLELLYSWAMEGEWWRGRHRRRRGFGGGFAAVGAGYLLGQARPTPLPAGLVV